VGKEYMREIMALIGNMIRNDMEHVDTFIGSSGTPKMKT
jgi:hypothetical protein